MRIIRSTTAAVALMAGAVSMSSNTAQSAQIMTADTGATGNIVHAMMLVYGKLFSQHLGISVQINGQPDPDPVGDQAWPQPD